MFSLLDAANFVADAVAALADGITFDAQRTAQVQHVIEDRGILLLEDSPQALGGGVDRAGTDGDLQLHVYSFIHLVDLFYLIR